MFKNELENQKQNGRFKDRIIFSLIILMIIMSIGWSAAPTQITVHYPPDLRSGATKKIGEIDDSEVFLFTTYILQQLNNWKDDGEKDYQKKISILRSYFTPAYQAYLKQDYSLRKSQGELRNRVRNFSPLTDAVFNAEKDVQLIGKNWVVWIDVQIKEYVQGGLVKNLTIRMPMQVVRYDVDREMNPWGLALNGPGQYKQQLIEVAQ